MALPRINKLDPTSLKSNSEKPAFTRALRIFHEAAERVPAYKNFLQKEGVKHKDIRSKSDFESVPLIDKQNYFTQYSLEEMSWDGTLANAKYVSKSSGSSGLPFFWPRGEEQDVMIGLMTQRIYEDIFDARNGTTLFVNSFSLGSWIAGMEFFNSVRWAAEHGTKITVVTPGIDKAEAVDQIKKLAPFYSRVILAGYPPFVKDILDHGITNGVDWERINLKLFFGGEAVSEIWKDNIFKLAGKSGDEYSRSVNIYGMAESGIVAHETPASILLRRNLSKFTNHDMGLLDENQVTGLYQYYPLARYFEVVQGDSLVLTANAGLPLIRCSTRDNGGIIKNDILTTPELKKLAIQEGVNLKKWQMPFVYLNGRKDLSISYYALIIYNENLKYAFENSLYAQKLSGLFTMSVTHKENMDQQFNITIELTKGIVPSDDFARSLTLEITKKVSSVNSEYAKLCSAIGDKAMPVVTLVPYGSIETTPGRKHKWVKKL